MPLVSIITASYNYGKYIKETIESVVVQTFTDWELIIVDDGSTDNSIDVIESYCSKDDRIKLYTHDNNLNKGLKDTLLLGLEKAKSDWIVFLESDDSITPDYLEKKFEVIKNNPDVKFIINDVNLIGEKDEVNRLNKHFRIINRILKSPLQPLDLSVKMFKLNYVVSFSVVMIYKPLLQNLDYNSSLKPMLDYYLWCQILRNNKVFYVDKKLTNWRLHKNSYISDIKNNTFEQILFFDGEKAKILFKDKNNILYSVHLVFLKLKYLWKNILYLRKKIIKIHIKDSEIFFLGKCYKYGK